MKVYFVRHGQTDWNVQSRIQGQSDIPLNQRGIAQAKALVAQLKTLAIDCIITSPLQRTKQTAALLNETLQVPILEEEGLKERDFGEFEGVLKSEMDFDAAFDYEQDRHYESCENIRDFYERIYTCLDELKKKMAGQSVLLVAHGAVSIAIYYYAQGKQYDGSPTSHIAPNAELVCFEL